MKYPIQMNQRIRVKERRASQTHHAPQATFAQSGPARRVAERKTKPISAAEAATASSRSSRRRR
jgi:hypothetical protein